MIKRQHGKALASHTEKLRRQVDKLKRNPTRKRSSLGLALHRLRQAAEKAGVTLPEEYQRKPKKKTAQTTETPREDRFDTMPEVEDLANKKTFRERSLALRGYKPENLIEIAAHAFLQDKAVNEEVDAKVRELEREYKDLANTEARLGSEEELAKEGGFYRYQDAEQATREKREEIQNLARIDIYNKVYRSVVLHLRDQKTNYVERRNAIQSRIKELAVSVDTSETMPAVTPTSGTAQRQSVLDIAEEAQRLEGSKGTRSLSSTQADKRLIEAIKDLISSQYQGVEDVNFSDRSPNQYTVKERELNKLNDYIETLESAQKRTRTMTSAQAQRIREGVRGQIIDEMRNRVRIDSRIQPSTPTTARDQLTSTAQEIITEADQDHDERHDEHQSIEQFELGEHTHTRTGVKLFTAKQKGRTDRDEYRRRVEIAKKHNGRYERRYVKGFLFKTAEDARNFALEVEGGQVEESAETVTPHEDHPQADNFETMVEVESAEDRTRGDLQSKQQALDLVRRSQEKAEPKFKRRTEESKSADQAVVDAIRQILGQPDPTQDLSARERRRLVEMLWWLGHDMRSSHESKKEERQRARDTIGEILEQQVKMLSEALDPRPIPKKATAPKISPPIGITLNRIRNALSSSKGENYYATGGYLQGRAVLPTKGDLRILLSEEERLKQARRDLMSVGSKNIVGKIDPRSDIMYALQRYMSGPLSELNQGTLKNLEDNYFKIALRDNTGEKLNKVKSEISRFWREWGGEYKRLHGEFVTERTQGEALRSIRNLIPERALTPEINQLLDQMERELDQRLLSDIEPFYAIDTAETNLATKEQPPTPPREQAPEPDPSPARQALTETADEIMSPSTSALNIDQANAQDTLTENRTRNPESKATDKALIESARELAKTSERGDEIRAAVLDLMNAQQLKRYKRATGETGLRAEDMIEKRRAARERLRGVTSGATVQGEDRFDTMPEVESVENLRAEFKRKIEANEGDISDYM